MRAPAGSGDGRTQSPQQRGALALAALGVVYGDIGTSPLYAMREAFGGEQGRLEPTVANVTGVLSLVVWSLLLVVSLKYLTFLLRVDNDGEGGIMVLTSLLPARPGRRRAVLVLAGLFGTALLYGDGMITPAISVLAAVEGAEVAVPGLARFSVPLAVVILVALFSVQHRGTGRVGQVFGPVMLAWFTVLAVLGLRGVLAAPGVLVALDPSRGLRFLLDNGTVGVVVLGAVFLVVTGAEALYADLGHFGRGPIATGWYAVVLPALVLNYLGQGALLLSDPTAVTNPLFNLAPTWAVVPLSLLAMAATVIASQALITGAFSLTVQAARFGHLPRLRTVHTSASARGQVYVPVVNWVLMVACVGLVVGFGTSSALAAAYGVAVTTTMLLTTVLFYVVVRERRGWRRAPAMALCGLFLVVDLAFVAANVPKVPAGGWFPLVVGGLLFTVLTTWTTGRRLVRERARRGRTPLQAYMAHLELARPPRVPGTAVHFFGVPGVAPPTLLTSVRTHHVLHERVLVVSVLTGDAPHVPPARRVERSRLPAGAEQVVLRYGFLDELTVADDLLDHLSVDPLDATYLVGREGVLVTDAPGMARWRERLFRVLRRNATSAAEYFHLPPRRVVELNTQVEL